MESWIESGCLVQVTAQSLLGRFGADARNVARQLMKRGLVHFIASDAHDAEDRTPRLDLAYKHVAGRYGRERAELLFVTNPLAVIEGEPLPEQPAPEADTGRKWFKFWG
jgi:protein-tyrosine phosphatase